MVKVSYWRTTMKRWIAMFGVLAAVGVAAVLAQPPGGPGSPGGGRPPSPIIEALDTDHDGVISAEELKNATESLLKLDTNKDGRLTEDEFRPQGGRPGQRGPGGGRPEGDGPRDRPEDRPGAGPDGGGRGDGPGRRPEGGGPGGPGGRGPGGGGPGGPGGPRGQGGGPGVNPDRMFTHAMEFDADKDGKLSPEELKKFIADFVQQHPGPGDEGRPGPGGPGGGVPRGGPPNGGGRPGEGGDRPERPKRPD